MVSLELHQRGDSNEQTKCIPIFMIKRKSPYIIPNLQLCDFFKGTQERVRNSRSKRAISIRATEVLLYSSFLDK